MLLGSAMAQVPRLGWRFPKSITGAIQSLAQAAAQTVIPNLWVTTTLEDCISDIYVTIHESRKLSYEVATNIILGLEGHRR